ncbi:MAG: SGNH/GDSL hydrolase family protein [Bacteroidetes bacterium]|nr:SGNH/GDSL hydrolase family protein [Bacteroidota bacterium]
MKYLLNRTTFTPFFNLLPVVISLVVSLHCSAQETKLPKSNSISNPLAKSVFIVPTDNRIQIEGSNYIKSEGDALVLHRHADAVYKGTNLSNLFHPIPARTCAGIVLKFKTKSPTAKVKFRIIKGKNIDPVFAVFQDGVFVENKSFKYVPDQEIVLDLKSLKAGRDIEYKITFPLKTDVHFLGIELKNGFDIVSYPKDKKPTYVAFGDSITHGSGQLTTPETYPYIVADKFGFELYNIAVGGAKTSQVMADLIKNDFKEIDVITILIGFNDYNAEGVTVETYKNRYEGVLNAIRTAHPKTKIFCITMTATKNNNAKKTGIAADDFRAVVKNNVANRRASGDANIFLIEGDKITTEANLKDAVHFSVEGARDFAVELYTKMSAILN